MAPDETRRRGRRALELLAGRRWLELGSMTAGGIWHLDRAVRRSLHRRMNFGGRHVFVDRSRGQGSLLVVLAGHKPHLWPYTLPRLERFASQELDVCIVSPGVDSPELSALAARRGWSQLITRRNDLCLAQNLAIRHHPAARWIHKLDEDIFIAEGYFEAMAAGYRAVQRDGRFWHGFCSPLLNVNGFSYRLFLDAAGLEGEYLERFGELTQASGGVAVAEDGEAARWVWERTLPFDAMAARIAARPFGYSPVPHRFSIGAILFERDLWEAIGGFVVVPSGGVGHDELQLCQECLARSRVPVVLHDVFAGHFSFGPQDPVMRSALPALASGLEVVA